MSEGPSQRALVVASVVFVAVSVVGLGLVVARSPGDFGVRAPGDIASPVIAGPGTDVPGPTPATDGTPPPRVEIPDEPEIRKPTRIDRATWKPGRRRDRSAPVPAGQPGTRTELGRRPSGAASGVRTDASHLPAPGLTATATGEDSVRLDIHDNSQDETYFYVMRTRPEGGYRAVWIDPHDGTGPITWTETGLTRSTKYTYYIAACDDIACSDWASDYTSTPPLPKAPTPVAALHISKTKIQIAWGDNATDEDKLELWRWNEKNGYKLLWTGTRAGTGTKIATISGLTPWQSSWYAARACYAGDVCTLTEKWTEVIPRPQWDDPEHADSVDYGIYWFRCTYCRNGQQDGVKAIAGQNDIYYRPNRPTLLYVHGWQPFYRGSPGSRETFHWGHGRVGSLSTDMAQAWHKAGWNVGVFYWNQFAADDWDAGVPFNSEAKIWTSRYRNGLGDVVNMRWRTGNGGFSHSFDELNLNVREIFAYKYEEVLGQQSKPIRLVGHSLGGQLAISGAKLLSERGRARMPERITLLEPYFSGNGRPYLGGRKTADVAADQVRDLQAAHRIVFEYYQTSEIPFARNVADRSAYVRVHPNHLGVDPVMAHQWVLYWYFRSLSLPAGPAEYTCNVLGSCSLTGRRIPNARTTTAMLQTYMNEDRWWGQRYGNGTPELDDDGFERKN